MLLQVEINFNAKRYVHLKFFYRTGTVHPKIISKNMFPKKGSKTPNPPEDHIIQEHVDRGKDGKATSTSVECPSDFVVDIFPDPQPGPSRLFESYLLPASARMPEIV